MLNWLKKLTGNKKDPRSYQVPDGLAERVCELKDQASVGSWGAHRKLWKLLEARCPEANQGNWTIRQDGSSLFLDEVVV